MESDVVAVMMAMAEVGVAFAGFTSIFLALTHLFNFQMSEDENIRLRIIIEVSIVSVLSAILPVVLTYTAIAEPYLWRITCGLLICYFASRSSSHLLFVRTLHKSTPLVNALLTGVFTLMLIIILGILLFPAFHGYYPLYIFCGLVVGSGNFAVVFQRTISSFARRPAES